MFPTTRLAFDIEVLPTVTVFAPIVVLPVVVLDLKRAQPIIGCLSALSVRIIEISNETRNSSSAT